MVFIAACDTSDAFTSWWDMNLNAAPGGRALVVPDLVAMAGLAVNQTVAPQYVGTVDPVLGTVGYQQFVNSLAEGKTVQQATSDANSAIAAIYSPDIYPAGKQLPMLVYKVIGNGALCPVGCRS